ncbi:hypothetical protein WJF12_23345, partial [Salmonella enterica subsp. enterica serovar Corvallis]
KLTVNLTKNSIIPPDYKGQNNPCWHFCLWAYSAGKDPWFTVIVCEHKNKTILSKTAMKKGVKIDPGNLTTDDWFKMSTGISKIDNKLADQVAAGFESILCW